MDNKIKNISKQYVNVNDKAFIKVLNRLVSNLAIKLNVKK